MRRISFNPRIFFSWSSFYLGWWACAAGASHGLYWLGPASVSLLAVVHLWTSPVPWGECAFLALLAAFGFVCDTALIQLGLFSTGGSSFAPGWLVCMWVLLGLTFEGLLAFRKNIYLLLIVGGASGPMSYVWAEGLGLLNYSTPFWLCLGMHAGVWVMLTWILFSTRHFCLSSDPFAHRQLHSKLK